MHYYQFNIADYRKDTAHLKPIEHYIYRTLIDWYYLDETPIPKETQVVIRRLSLETVHEPNLNNVLSDFFVLNEKGWSHKRIDQDISDYAVKCDKNATNGKLGGRPKKTQSVILANPNESEVNPNQEPLTSNQEPLKPIDTNVSIVMTKVIPDCPHQEIINLYSKNLPAGIHPKSWDGARMAALKSRWRESDKRQSVEWWDRFFGYIAKSPFLTGKVATKDRKPFEISLPWIVNKTNFDKIIDGIYHEK